MSVDPHVQKMKEKNVIAMEPVSNTAVEFTYLENGEVKREPLYGDKTDNIKAYAEICAVIWDGCAMGEGSEPCRYFKDGKLFVALRGPLGTRYVDFRYVRGFTRREGQTYVELTPGVFIKSSKNSEGNEIRLAEARKVADSLPGYWENGICSDVERPSMKQAEIPAMQESVSAWKKPAVKEKKKKPQKQSTSKEGQLTQDVMGAFVLDKEIQSQKWQHIQDMDKNSMDYKMIQFSKTGEMGQISAIFLDLLMQCDTLSS